MLFALSAVASTFYSLAAAKKHLIPIVQRFSGRIAKLKAKKMEMQIVFLHLKGISNRNLNSKQVADSFEM